MKELAGLMFFQNHWWNFHRWFDMLKISMKFFYFIIIFVENYWWKFFIIFSISISYVFFFFPNFLVVTAKSHINNHDGCCVWLSCLLKQQGARKMAAAIHYRSLKKEIGHVGNHLLNVKMTRCKWEWLIHFMETS